MSRSRPSARRGTPRGGSRAPARRSAKTGKEEESNAVPRRGGSRAPARRSAKTGKEEEGIAVPRRGAFSAALLSSDDDGFGEEGLAVRRRAVRAPTPQKTEGAETESDGEAPRRWADDEPEPADADALPVLDVRAGRWTHARVSSDAADSTRKPDAEAEATRRPDSGADATHTPDLGNDATHTPDLDSDATLSSDDAASHTPADEEDAADARRRLAETALAMTEAPGGAGDASFASRAREILAVAEDARRAAGTRALALVTIAAVLRDLMPGYRVRVASAAERAAPTSREVAQQRGADEAFLGAYARLVADLRGALLGGLTRAGGAAVRWRPHKASSRPVTRAALAVLCDLLVRGAHFNQYEALASTAVDALVRHAGDSFISERLSEAVGRAFAEETTGGEASLRLAARISAAAHALSYDAPLCVLRPLLAVRISDAPANGSGAEGIRRAPGEDAAVFRRRLRRRENARRHMSARERREDKARAAELARMASAEAAVSAADAARWRRETLRHVFRVFFGVLKRVQADATLTNDDARLSVVLEGVAKHARRIDAEYFCGLLHALRTLLAAPVAGAPERLGLVAALHCVLAVERMHALAESLAGMDMRVFYCALFRRLRHLPALPDAEWARAEAPLASVLRALFAGRRSADVSAARVASFVQRLADAALLASRGRDASRRTLFLLARMQQLLEGHAGVAARLLDDGDSADALTAADGPWAYSATADDPDAANGLRRPLRPVLEAIAAASPDRRVSSAVRALVKPS